MTFRQEAKSRRIPTLNTSSNKYGRSEGHVPNYLALTFARSSYREFILRYLGDMYSQVHVAEPVSVENP